MVLLQRENYVVKQKGKQRNKLPRIKKLKIMMILLFVNYNERLQSVVQQDNLLLLPGQVILLIIIVDCDKQDNRYCILSLPLQQSIPMLDCLSMNCYNRCKPLLVLHSRIPAESMLLLCELRVLVVLLFLLLLNPR